MKGWLRCDCRNGKELRVQRLDIKFIDNTTALATLFRDQMSILSLGWFGKQHNTEEIAPELNKETNKDKVIPKSYPITFAGEFDISPFVNMNVKSLPTVMAMIEDDGIS
eukprot:scaffold19953_cov37-Cyclotella_meneghiniana.AAC.1